VSGAGAPPVPAPNAGAAAADASGSAPRMRALRTARLRLEPQRAAHADEMFDVLSDPAIYAYENAPPKSAPALRERYVRLESRRSGDGSQLWLNWVLRVPAQGLIGYVQATVSAGGRASIGYELASAHWGRGYAQEAVGAMLDELARRYGVRAVFAVLKRANGRSRRLLERLGFMTAAPEARGAAGVEPDELLMHRCLGADGRGADAPVAAEMQPPSTPETT
jgi:RimJ/RimL family protein N-acetyltransferase